MEVSVGATSQSRTHTETDGSARTIVHRDDGRTITTDADGTSLTVRAVPDPRYGAPGAYAGEMVVRTPGGREQTTTHLREVVTASGEPDRIVTTSTVNGATTVSSYDTSNRTTTVTTPEGRSHTVQIDARGRIIATTSAAGRAPTSTEYDPRGRPCRHTAGSGGTTRVTTWRYDTAGSVCSETGGSPWPISITDPAGTTTSWTRDAAGRITSMTDGAGRTTTFVHDQQGNLTEIGPPSSSVHSQTFDLRDLRTAYDPPGPDGGLTWSYDLDDRLTGITRSDGSSAVTTLDGAGRPVEVVRTMDGIADPVVTLSYDAAGRPISTGSADRGQVSMTYDGAFGLETVTTHGPAGPTRIAITLDDHLRMASETVDAGTDAAHTVTHQYDDDRHLIGVGDLELIRDDAGRVIRAEIGEIVTHYGYDAFDGLSTIVAMHDSTTLYSATHTRDAIGRLVARSESIGGDTITWTYGYDGSGRLVSASRNGTGVTYTYDVNGNRVAGPGVSASDTEYDVRDLVVRYGDRHFTHGPAGDLRTETQGELTTVFDYDIEGSLRSIVATEGSEDLFDLSYGTDPLGRRHHRVEGLGGATESRSWRYRDDLLVAEYDDDGARRLRFVHGTSDMVPDYLVDTSGTSAVTAAIIRDGTGSPRLVVDVATGQVLQRLDFDEFGVVLLDTAPGYQPFGFHGGLHDPLTGLVRMGVRDYDPTLGRFTNPDPILFAGAQVNLFEFAGSDAVNRRDPSGMGPGGGGGGRPPREEQPCGEVLPYKMPLPTSISGLGLPFQAYQAKKGVDQIASGDVGLGTSNLVFGGGQAVASGLAVAATKTQVTAATAGAATGTSKAGLAMISAKAAAPIAAVGAVAGGYAYVAKDSIDAALEGRPTPIEVAWDYYRTNLFGKDSRIPPPTGLPCD